MVDPMPRYRAWIRFADMVYIEAESPEAAAQKAMADYHELECTAGDGSVSIFTVTGIEIDGVEPPP